MVNVWTETENTRIFDYKEAKGDSLLARSDHPAIAWADVQPGDSPNRLLWGRLILTVPKPCDAIYVIVDDLCDRTPPNWIDESLASRWSLRDWIADDRIFVDPICRPDADIPVSEPVAERAGNALAFANLLEGWVRDQVYEKVADADPVELSTELNVIRGVRAI